MPRFKTSGHTLSHRDQIINVFENLFFIKKNRPFQAVLGCYRNYCCMGLLPHSILYQLLERREQNTSTLFENLWAWAYYHRKQQSSSSDWERVDITWTGYIVWHHMCWIHIFPQKCSILYKRTDTVGEGPADYLFSSPI